MDYIKNKISEVIAKVNECESLMKDQEIVQTKSVKCVIDDMQHQLFNSLIEICTSIKKYIDEKKTEEMKLLAEEQKPVYFDIIQQSGVVLPHIGSNGLTGNEQIIRSYNKHNKVVFEDTQLVAKCVNYNDMYQQTNEKVKKNLAKGHLKFTSLSGDSNECDDYLEQLYKKSVDSIELSEDEKLPESFINAMTGISAATPVESQVKEEIEETKIRVPGKAILDKLTYEGNKQMKTIIANSNDEEHINCSMNRKQSEKAKGKKSKKNASKAAK